MKKYNICFNRNDLICNKDEIINTEIKVINNIKKDKIYKTIFFNNEYNIINALSNQLVYFFNNLNITKKDHIFIIGLGNENHTADSVGPKSLKNIRVNSFLENLGIEIIDNKVSALSPGVLGETGIITERIIKSVSNEIKPNLIILIDSFVSNNINYLNKTIEINNVGLNPGSGLKGIDFKIDKNSLNIPIIVIGVTTAIEIKFSDNNDFNYIPYLLSTNNIDEYVDKISSIIGKSINKAINDL